MPTLQAEFLEKAISAIFRACGVPVAEAKIVADHLVEAEACGLVSHGVIRVPQYVKSLADGHIVPDARLRVVSETTATAVLDGQRGFGQVMAQGAMDWALDRAGQTGIAAASLFNCGHTGRVGSYTERAAQRGMIGMMMVNSGGNGQWVAPFGGIAGRLATNPISAGVPAGKDAPMVLDMATSIAPEGRVRAALTAGQPVPDGWIIDHEGRPTTDPAKLYGPPRGALLPFGGHKGFGLSMLVDALAGGLSGAGCCTKPDMPMGGKTDGVFIIAINVAAFQPLPEFAANIANLGQHVKTAPPAPGVKEVLFPGELEARTKCRRLIEGIPVEANVWKSVRQLLDRFKLSETYPDVADSAPPR